MNIKTNDIRRFKKLAAHLIGHGIIPSSNCIKFGGGVIAKNCASGFASQECADSDQEILVDEQSLYSVVDETSAEFINITVKDNKTVLFDGRDKVPVPSINRKEFSELPIADGQPSDVSTEFLIAIGRAQETAAGMAVPATLYMYLHVGQNSVCAGSGFVGVYFPIEEDFTMVIEKKVAAILAKLDINSFAESKSHYFFYGSEFYLGFSKQEIGYTDMKRIMAHPSNELSFSFGASDLLSFNRLAMSLTKGEGVVTMSNGKIEMYDSITEKSQVRAVENLQMKDEFSFRPENMTKALTALDVEDLDFYEGKGMYYIKSPDTQAIAIIGKISK